MQLDNMNKIGTFFFLQRLRDSGSKVNTLCIILMVHRKRIAHYIDLCKNDAKSCAYNHALANYFAKRLSISELGALSGYIRLKTTK